MKKTSLAIILLLALLAAISNTYAQSGPPPMQEVEASGQAADADTAFKQAVNDAVRQVVGTLVSAENVIKNERVIKDEVLLLSNGFVEKVLNQDKTKLDDGTWQVKLKCIVRKGQLYGRLQEANVPTIKFDGVSIFADVVSQLDHEKSSGEMIRSALKKVSANLVTATMLAEKPKILERDERFTEIEITWIASVDVDAFFKNCAPALDAAFSGAALSKSKKPVVTPIKYTKDSGILLRGVENFEAIDYGADKSAAELQSHSISLLVQPHDMVAIPVESRKDKWGIVFYHIDKRILHELPGPLPAMFVIAHFRDADGNPLLEAALDCLEFRDYTIGKDGGMGGAVYNFAFSCMPLIGEYGNDFGARGTLEYMMNSKRDRAETKQLSEETASSLWDGKKYTGSSKMRMQSVVRIPTVNLSKISKIDLSVESVDIPDKMGMGRSLGGL